MYPLADTPPKNAESSGQNGAFALARPYAVVVVVIRVAVL